jgi:mRNA export factor
LVLKYYNKRDVRQSKETEKLNVGERVYSMSQKEQLLAVATAERAILIFDIRKPTEVIKKIESSLKGQTRCCTLITDIKGNLIIKLCRVLCRIR